MNAPLPAREESAEGGLLSARGLLKRRLGGVAGSALGTGLVMGLLVAMNNQPLPDTRDRTKDAIHFEAPPEKRQPPPQQKPRPKPKKRQQAAPPAPLLSASLSGLSFGLDAFAFGDALGGADALLGDVQDVVMTEDSVDAPPRAVARGGASYPARARARNIEGYVTLSLLVEATGQVRDVQVLEAQPPGVFEEAARAAVSSWRFEPGIYEGRPVTVRVRQTIRFELE